MTNYSFRTKFVPFLHLIRGQCDMKIHKWAMEGVGQADWKIMTTFRNDHCYLSLHRFNSQIWIYIEGILSRCFVQEHSALVLKKRRPRVLFQQKFGAVVAFWTKEASNCVRIGTATHLVFHYIREYHPIYTVISYFKNLWDWKWNSRCSERAMHPPINGFADTTTLISGA